MLQTKSGSFVTNSLSAYIAFSAGFLLRLLLYRAVFLKLGADLFGTWAVLKSVFILPGFLQQALHTAIFVRTARNPMNSHRIGELLLLTLAVSLPLAIIAFGFASNLASFFHLNRFHELAVAGFRICAVLFVFESFSQLFLRILQGLSKYRDAAVLTTAIQFLNSTIAIILIYNGYQILSILLVDLASTGILVLFAIVCVKHRLAPARFSFDTTKERIQNLLAETGGQFVTVLSGRLLWELDPWLIPRFFGIPAMTSYYLGRRLPYTISDLLWTGAEPVVPAAANAGKEDWSIDRIHLLQVSLAVPIGFFLWIFAQDILKVWIGLASPDAIFILQMLALARTIDFLPTIFLYFYFAEGKVFRIMWITAAAAILKIIASAIAILNGNLEFLIITTVAGATVYATLLFVDVHRETGKTVARMLLPFLSGVAASAISWSIVLLFPEQSFLVRASLFAGVVTVLMLFQFRFLSKMNA